MAEKEERILIARSTDYTITDTDKGARFDGKIAPHCANVFTRKEAIERMAKAFVEYEKINNPNACDWSDLKERAKDFPVMGCWQQCTLVNSYKAELLQAKGS